MKKRIHFLLLLLLLVLAAAAVIFGVRYLHAKGNTVATITLDGKVVATYDLSRVTTTDTFTLGEPGAQNTIRVSPAGIAVISADCADQVCVKQGVRSHGPTPIVCLPHKLSITFSKPDDSDALDAVAGQ